MKDGGVEIDLHVADRKSKDLTLLVPSTAEGRLYYIQLALFGDRGEAGFYRCESRSEHLRNDSGRIDIPRV